MLPIINIFGHEIATYGICAIIGMSLGIIVAVYYFSKFNNLKREDVLYAGLFALIGVGIGAKLLYVITEIPSIIQNYYIMNLKEICIHIMQGGFVFYGGLIGGIIGIFIYAKVFKISFKSLIFTAVPVIPLIHAIGRIGCFLAGCCYGMEYNGFGHVIFYDTQYAPINVPLFPTQIIECLCNILIFIFLFVTYKRFKGTYKTTALYCILYSIVRFVLEFFRGDIIRGFIFSLSTSQWISIIIFIVGIMLFTIEIKNNKKE